MLRLPPRRNEWYRDRDGIWTRQKLQDEVLVDEIVFDSGTLAGATVSSHSWVNVSGPSITGDAVNGESDGVDFTITNSGTATLQVVLSDGRTLRERFRWIGLDTTALSDYGG